VKHEHRQQWLDARKGCSFSKGFTLIEVLLAMVVTVMVLGTCGMLYYSIAQAWISHKQGDVELQHDHSIFAFLEQQLCIQPNQPDGLPSAVDSSLSWAQLPEASTYDPKYLSWLVKTPPVFVENGEWTDHFAARLYLKYEPREGLSILWHPDDNRVERMEFTNYQVEDYLYEFPLTDKVVSLRYAYWDKEKDEWVIESHTRNYDPGEKGVPDALLFEVEEKETITRTLYLGKETSANAN